jgi:hypothetical protein
LRLDPTVGSVERIHPDVLTRNSRFTLERDDPSADGLDIDPRPPNYDAIAAAEHPKAKTEASVQHGSRTDPRLRQPATDHVRTVSVTRRVVSDAQRAARQPTEHVPADVDHHHTFTALDGQYAYARLGCAGEAGEHDEGRGGGKRDEGKRPHCSKASIGIRRVSAMRCV